MNKELTKEVIEILEHYKTLSEFVENEVPYSIAQDIRQDLYLNTYIDDLISKLNA